MYKSFIKRLFDLIFSFLLIVFLLPVGLFLIILIIIDSEGSPFYTQERIGYNGKSFWIIKLRTMRSNSERSGSGLFTDKSDPRITSVGKILRNYSLDELPQLINILKGDMSFVGPRPPVPYHPYTYKAYPNKFKLRFDLLPGITGLAQISGRTNLTWPQRLEYDIEYAQKISFLFDIKILIKTVFKIIRKDDIFPEDIDIGKKHLNQTK